MRKGTVIVLLLAGMLMVSGCRRGAPQGQPPASPAAPSPGAPAAGATVINVSEAEFKFNFSRQTVPAGQVTFQIKNEGTVEHNFIVCSNNPAGNVTGCPQRELITLEAIQPGQTQMASVTLQPGEYKIVCTVPGHEEAGMKVVLRAQ